MAKRFKLDQRVQWSDEDGKVFRGKVIEEAALPEDAERRGILSEDAVVIVHDEHGLPRGVPVRLLSAAEGGEE